MKEKKSTKENTYDMGIAGNTGAIATTAGWGTFASPNVSQNSANFVSGKNQADITATNTDALNNKMIGAKSNTLAGAPASPSALDATVNQIYSKEITPSVDEVMTGLKYEMQNMIKKDKARAKDVVLANLKQDPHYYGKLGMWNISDKNMMNVQPANQSKTPAELQMEERINVLNQMIKAKGKRTETPQSIKDAIAETKAKRDARYS
jgi:hypothetical protein